MLEEEITRKCSQKFVDVHFTDLVLRLALHGSEEVEEEILDSQFLVLVDLILEKISLENTEGLGEIFIENK